MDLPVVLIKIRDYLFWFGPAYLLAISLGAATEVFLKRLLGSPISANPSQYTATPSSLWSYLRYSSSRLLSSQPRTMRSYIWAAIISQSISWPALLMTAALSWPLSMLRLGLTLILGSLLAAAVPYFAGNVKIAPVNTAPGVQETGNAPIHREWWGLFKRRFSKSIDDLALGAAFGGVVMGLAPEIYALLGATLDAPGAYLWGPLVGTLTALTPGMDMPLFAAMQTRGLEEGSIALMLAVSVAPLGLVRKMKAEMGPRATGVYLAATWLLSALAAWLLYNTGLMAGAI